MKQTKKQTTKDAGKPTHPGKVLYQDVIKPLGLSITSAAKYLGVSRTTISELVSGKVALSPVMALRIGMATDSAPEDWMLIQFKLDMWKAKKKLVQKVKKLPSIPK